MQARLLLIDAPNFFRRLFSAQIHHTDALSPEQVLGLNLQAVRTLQKQLAHHKPSHFSLIHELAEDPEHAQTWRHALYPDYKIGRKPTPQNYIDWVTQLIEGDIQKLGWSVVKSHNVEADDIIATLANTACQHRIETHVLSTDHLIAQLCQPFYHQFDPFNQSTLDAAFIEQRYQVKPEQLVDYFSLAGNSSLGLKGVVGVGPKAASELLQQHGSIEALWPALESLKPALQKKLAETRNELIIYQQICGLKTDLKLHFNLKHLRLNHV